MTHHADLVSSDVLRIKSILLEVTTQITNIASDLTTDAQLKQLLSTDYPSEEDFRRNWDSYQKIETYQNTNAAVDDIRIYYGDNYEHDLKYLSPVTTQIASSDWYQEAIKQSSAFWLPIQSYDAVKNECWKLCFVCKLPLFSTAKPAVLVIQLSDNYFRNRIINNEYKVLISMNQPKQVVFSTYRTLYGKDCPVPIDYNKNYYTYTGNLQLFDHDYISSTSTLTIIGTDAKFYITSLDADAYPNIARILLTCGTILAISVLIPCLLILSFSRFFSSRINTLRTQMHRASNGDYNILDSFQGDDEITEVFQDLKIMVHNIKEKDSKMYEAKIKEQKLINQQHIMEFKALSSQINPHFLYNALETIRMKAFTTGDIEVATAIKLLGKSMRYVLENTGTSSTTLQKELDYIEIYLQIQKLRFGDRINYVLTVQDNLDLNCYEILPLLLQPIIENAASHGLENTDGDGLIQINVHTPNDYILQIDISDNGIGMDEQELKKVIQRITTPNPKISSNIGLYNIYQRIKLCYGEPYGFTISSSPQSGTLVSLTLPSKII